MQLEYKTTWINEFIPIGVHSTNFLIAYCMACCLQEIKNDKLSPWRARCVSSALCPTTRLWLLGNTGYAWLISLLPQELTWKLAYNNCQINEWKRTASWGYMLFYMYDALAFRERGAVVTCSPHALLVSRSGLSLHGVLWFFFEEFGPWAERPNSSLCLQTRVRIRDKVNSRVNIESGVLGWILSLMKTEVGEKQCQGLWGSEKGKDWGEGWCLDCKSYCQIQDKFKSKSDVINNYTEMKLTVINLGDPRQIAMNGHPIQGSNRESSQIKDTM